MKRIIICLILIIFLTGCVTVVEKVEEEKDIPPSPVKEIKVEEKIISPGEQVPEEPEIIQTLSPALTALKKRADDKVKSYSFLYAPPPENLAQDKWYIKGNKIKIERFGDQYYQAASYYDTIYMDAQEKTAIGYCLSKLKGQCPEGAKKFFLNYNDVTIKTPYQIVKTIPYGEIIGSELLWDRSYQVAQYIKDNITYKIWIDSFSGLATKLALYDVDGNEIRRYEYRHLQINNIEDAQITPPIV